jgi:hypothetical protein
MLANFQHPPGAEARSFIASHRRGQNHCRVTSPWLRGALDGVAFAVGMLTLASADLLVSCVTQVTALGARQSLTRGLIYGKAVSYVYITGAM